MALPDNFAVFILTHGRPDNVITIKTLQHIGYTGKCYIVIDNEDTTAEQYYKNFGNNVIMFDKSEIAMNTDCGDNFEKRNTVLFARNAVFDIAKNVNIEWFLVLDDDYTGMFYKIDHDHKYLDSKSTTSIHNADNIFLHLLNFYKSINCKTLAIAQGGDFIGGKNSSSWTNKGLRRKAMNFFICSTHRRFNFMARMNDDVTTYTKLGNIGQLFLTNPLLAIMQKATQKNAGGLTNMYLEYGTYIKSFYSVMYQPSSIKISMLNSSRKRLHHAINWNNTVPCIIPESYKK